ncbi:MAG: 16S rRNA (cytidine(1402)-2'-O)-methyltransferase [Gammaproteobacteria bacterium]|nr:16S rRNA (cytidine(1402)-2'-O)-methyltransferase [Gammaproteobacteria bacterium]
MTQQAGVLYVVATPIGNLDDLSPRARRVLAEVDLIAAEDTRHTARLLNHFGMRTPLLSLHDYNEAERAPRLVERLQTGQSVALVADAGTPLISDPGYDLVRAARAAGINVSPIPGPCALIAALSVSGLPTDRFVFEGFLPQKTAARHTRLGQQVRETRTLVYYEAVHRLAESLDDMAQVFGGARPAVIARELTKLHESMRAGTLASLAEWARTDSHAAKGEAVVLVSGAATASNTADADSDAVLAVLLEELPLKQAAALAAKLTGQKRNMLYQRALKISKTKNPSR